MYTIYSLKCNDLKNPEGISLDKICFSWKLKSDKNNTGQLAYSIRVVDECENIVWDSGKIESDKTFDIYYEGPKLQPHTCYSWQVTSWKDNGSMVTSEKAYFTVAMSIKDLEASWIEADTKRKSGEECTEMWKIFSGIVKSAENPEEFLNPPVYLRKTFKISKKISKVIAYATARGIYQLSINGEIVSDHFTPEYTSYPNYLEVQQYDITKSVIEESEQVIGVILADGWYTGKIGLVGIGNQYGENNAFYMQLEVFYEDGSHETLLSDKSFKWRYGNYEYADLFVGERYKQNQIQDSWQFSGYDDSKWKNVVEKDYGIDNFRWRKAEPIRILRKGKIPRIIVTPKEELVLDVGENIVGFLHLKIKGKKGDSVRLTHSEVLDQEGNFLMNIIGQNKNQMDVIIFEEDSIIEYKPCFTFHGFQFVKVEGATKEQILESEFCVIGTDLDVTGEFECSDERLNKLQGNIFRSQQGNMVSIPTDCPQRERAGWTGDMQVYTPTACFNMDMYSFLDKWLENMRYEQLPDGQIQNIVPMMDSDKYVRKNESEQVCSAAWGDACVIIPYELFWKYGKKRILEDNYTMMKKWMDYVEKEANNSFIKPIDEYTKEELENQRYLWNTGFHFGDWLYPSAENPFGSAETTKEYVAPTMYAYTTNLMSEICDVLGLEEESKRYSHLHQKICQAYAATYIDENGRLPLQLQGLYVLALKTGCYPEEKKELGIKQLVELIHDNDNRLDTGFASIGFLLDVLCENGFEDFAYKILFQTKSPSWLYEVEMGANTIWERWNAILPSGERTNSSYNHFAFGCVGDFIYRKIGGLYALEPGYRTVLIEPDIEKCGLEEARVVYESVYGKIQVHWQKKKGGVELLVELPVNVKGRIKIGNNTYHVSSRKVFIANEKIIKSSDQ